MIDHIFVRVLLRTRVLLPHLIAAAILTAGSASAQDVAIRATVNNTTVGTEENVTYSIEIEGADLSEVHVPEPPSAENLALSQSIPSTTRNVSIVNGAFSQSVIYRWNYRPLAEGAAVLNGTTVRIADEVHRTDSIRLTVVPQSQRPQQPSGGQRSGWPFSARPTQPDQPPPTLDPKDLFLRVVPSKREAYTNEQIILEYYLYGRDYIQLRQSRMADSWDAEGFWREEMEIDTRPVPRTVVENGLRYNVILLKRVAVFPTRAGALRIDPLRIETEIYLPSRSNDPFSTFFPSGNFRPVEVASPRVSIDVLPLPSGAPEGFRGAVGDFRLEAALDQQSVRVGESVQVDVEISGTGNIATLEAPPIEAPGIFESYDPQTNTVVNRSGTVVGGSKTITHVLVPRSNGTFDMPAVSLVYFDPQRGRYERTSADLGEIRVTGTAGPAAEHATRAGLPVDDIAGLKSGEVHWRRLGGTPLHASPIPYVILLLPMVAAGGTILYRRRAQRIAADVGYARNRRAHPLARKHLRQAETLLKQNRPREFYAEVERALLGFVGNRLNIPDVGLTRQQLDAHLSGAGVAADVRADLQGLLQESEQAQYAPVPPERQAMETAIDRAGRTIVAINEAVSRLQVEAR